MARTLRFAALALIVGVFLTACGGGGSSSSAPSTPNTTITAVKLSGMAAGGAPIVGTVTVQDSSNPVKTSWTTIEADGSYEVNVAGMTAPFALRADGRIGGREVHLYSAAVAADINGNINITPFTDLILAQIAGDIAANYFDNATYKNLTPTQLSNAQTSLQAKLLPILTEVGLSNSVDLLRTSFSANHQGLDAVLDMVQVSYDNTGLVATLTNIATANAITYSVNTPANTTGSFTTQDGQAIADGLTDLQQIMAGFATFESLFATGLPAYNDPALVALFATDANGFMFDGMTRDMFLSGLTMEPQVIGIKLSGIKILEFAPADTGAGTPATAKVGFDMSFNGVPGYDTPKFFYMRKDPTLGWQNTGNQQLVKLSVEVKAHYRPQEVSNKFDSGLDLSVSDEGNQGVDYAIVTGPGLPQNGVLLLKNISDNDFYISGQYYHDHFYDTPDYAAISKGATYTFAIYDVDDNKMGEYTFAIDGPPVNPANLTAAHFPTIVAPTQSTWANYTFATATNVPVQWQLPSGMVSDYVYIYISGTEGSREFENNFFANPTATSTTLTGVIAETIDHTTFTNRHQNLSVAGMDSQHRFFETNMWYQTNN